MKRLKKQIWNILEYSSLILRLFVSMLNSTKFPQAVFSHIIFKSFQCMPGEGAPGHQRCLQGQWPYPNRAQFLSLLLPKHHQHLLKDETKSPVRVLSGWLGLMVFSGIYTEPYPLDPQSCSYSQICGILSWTCPGLSHIRAQILGPGNLLWALCNLALKIWENGDCTTSLGKLFWCLQVFLVKKNS